MVEPRLTAAPGRDTEIESLARRYARLIRSVVGRVAGRAAADIGEEVEQKVLIGIWRSLQGEQTIEHPTSYVYKAAVRETIRVLRSGDARQADALAEGPDEPAARGVGDDPQRLVQAREVREGIEGCLVTLTADRQEAVRAHLAGFDVQEIMAFHGWTYQKARNLVARGIADLRRCLQGKGIRG